MKTPPVFTLLRLIILMSPATLGAASSLRRSAGAARLPVNVEEHEGLVASLRTRLGDDAYDAAWHRGAALGADEAVALALE